jgi:hypothetical protein
MKKTLAALCAVILAAAVSARAEEWNTMGPRAMGMGGAGVALAQGPLASYWNPAALGRLTENAYGFAAPVSVHAALTGSALEGVKDFQNVENACKAGNLTACTQANLTSALGELNQSGTGLRADLSTGGDFKIGKISFFANGFLDAGAVPRMDLVNTSTTPTSAQFVGNNQSALIVKGAQIMEFGAGYGHELPFAPGVFIGGDVKLMKARVGYAKYIIAQNSSNGESTILNTFKTGEAESGNIGVDAGALWDVTKSFDGAWWQPRLGVVGRNLNNPKFSQPSSAAADGVGGRYAVNPQARLGLAISPLHWWNIAADLDLTRNLTPVDGVASRQLGLGTEINIFNRSWINIPLRFGVARNVETATNMVTIGSGLNFLHLIIDFSGEASPQRVQTQSQGGSSKVPQEFGASVSLSLLFGGSEEEYKSMPASKASNASNDLPPAQSDQIRKNAAQSQKELDQAKPAPAGK